MAMFEDALGRLVAGALWGVGAGVVIAVTRGGGEGVRDIARGAIKGYLAVADRVQEASAEMREGFEDLAAEARAERAAGSDQSAD
ncbi:MAG: DUF5132 domain-containing protein [Chloroflexi bacterium]|nr:DUF5132 domain-containing protein [Chloroflexota bacterium]